MGAGDYLEADACSRIADWIKAEDSDIIEFTCGDEKRDRGPEEARPTEEKLMPGRVRIEGSLGILKAFYEDRSQLPTFFWEGLQKRNSFAGVQADWNRRELARRRSFFLFLLRVLFPSKFASART